MPGDVTCFRENLSRKNFEVVHLPKLISRIVLFFDLLSYPIFKLNIPLFTHIISSNYKNFSICDSLSRRDLGVFFLFAKFIQSRM